MVTFQNKSPVVRCPGPSTKEIHTTDRRQPPSLFEESGIESLGHDDLPMDAYLNPDFHRQEVAKVWKRCWQMATRSELVRDPGSHVVYDIVDDSALVVRGRDGQLRAFVNSCPHRGSRLLDADGKTLRIRCPFHGLTWTLAGQIDKWPCSWDFSHVEEGGFNLQEIQVGEWNGFVFVNFDPEAPSLAEYLEDLPEHFARWPLDARYTAAHVGKVMHCNWKIALEAFLETFHVVGIHTEVLPFFGDANSQYDVWEGQRHFSRMINPTGVISPNISDEPAPERVLASAARYGLCSGDPLLEGETPRHRIADEIRRMYREGSGVDLSEYSDAEMADVIEYFLFPNLVMFGGFNSPLAYRARPYGDDPGKCLFEVWLLPPFASGTQPPAPSPFRLLAEHERFADVPELSHFGPVVDQDADAMPLVQRGMRSSTKRKTTLGKYQEIRIRHMRQTLAEYLAR